MTTEDHKHVGELGDLKDTKYWFKRDLSTMKLGLNRTARVTPILFTSAILFSLRVNYVNQTLSLIEVVFLSVIFLPIFMLGYFLFYIMVNKGYNIHAGGGGTVIDRSRTKVD